MQRFSISVGNDLPCHGLIHRQVIVRIRAFGEEFTLRRICFLEGNVVCFYEVVDVVLYDVRDICRWGVVGPNDSD